MINRLKDDPEIEDALAGVIIGEEQRRNEGLLNQILDIGQRINVGTDGWLREHHFIALGGGFGAKFQNIDEAVANFDFESKMASTCPNFSFGFKFFDASNFDFNTRDLPRNPTKEEWRELILTGSVTQDGTTVNYPFTLNDFIALGTYDLLFFGDSADGSTNITNRLKREAWDALKEIFAENNWKNYFFGIAFQDDQMKTLITPEGGNDTFEYGRWQEWRNEVTLGLGEKLPSNIVKMEAYPNPLTVGKTLRLHIDPQYRQELVAVDFFDLSGKKVLRFPLEKVKKEGMLDVGNLRSGIYLLRSTFKEGVSTIRISIH